MEVQNHCVKYSARFSFPCKMNANASSGILETCNVAYLYEWKRTEGDISVNWALLT